MSLDRELGLFKQVETADLPADIPCVDMSPTAGLCKDINPLFNISLHNWKYLLFNYLSFFNQLSNISYYTTLCFTNSTSSLNSFSLYFPLFSYFHYAFKNTNPEKFTYYRSKTVSWFRDLSARSLFHRFQPAYI